jgi:hypothetical protein
MPIILREQAMALLQIKRMKVITFDLQYTCTYQLSWRPQNLQVEWMHLKGNLHYFYENKTDVTIESYDVTCTSYLHTVLFEIWICRKGIWFSNTDFKTKRTRESTYTGIWAANLTTSTNTIIQSSDFLVCMRF